MHHINRSLQSSLVTLSTLFLIVSAGLLGVALSAHQANGTLSPSAPFDYVLTIVMENRAFADIIGNPSAPYLNQLATSYGLATNFHSVSQYGSLPEYLALVSGNSYDTSWSRCNNPPSACTGWPSGGVTDPTVVDRIEGAGLSWKAYMEDMPSDCYRYNSGSYMPIHNPFVYFSHVINNASECAKVVPAGTGDSALLSDLGSTSTAPNYTWLTPNNCNDMWGCSTTTGDTYLSNLIPNILNTAIFKTQKAAVFITWDEDDTTSHITGIWAGPAVKQGYSSGVNYNQYSQLKTIETALGLPTLTSNDAAATAMTEFFRTGVFQAGFTYTPSNPFAGQTISFAGSASGGSSPYSFSWNFGDGATATGNTVNHIYSVQGSYTVSLFVKDSVGSTTSTSQTIVVSGPPDFSMSLNPSSLTVSVGASGSSTLTLKSLNGFSGSVTLSISVAPPGPTASVSTTTINLSSGGTATSTLNIKTTNTVGPGNYNISITGASGNLTHSTTLPLTVRLAPDFAMTPNPTSFSMIPGNSVSFTITLTSLNNFNGPVSLSASVSAGGFGVQLNPSNPTVPSGGASSSTLTITSPNNAVPDSYTVSLTGTSGSITHTITIPLAVIGFALAINPGDVSFPASMSGSFNVTLASLNGFSGNVTLADQVSNNHLIVSLGSTIINVPVGGTAVTLLTASSSANGGYLVTVSASFGKLLRKVSVTVDVTSNPDFTISANPIFLEIMRGSSGASTITATSVNGLSGNMNLKASVNPSGPIVSLNPTSIRVSPSSSSTSTLTISVPSSVPVGLYSIVVTGASGPNHSVTIWLFIARPEPDFAISASPVAVSVTVNQAGTSTVTVTALQGFSEVVSMTSNSTSCTLTPSSVTGSGSSALSCTFTSIGTFHVTVAGTSASLSHSTMVTYNVGGVKDFTVTANPTSVTVPATLTGNSTITVSSLSGFAGKISLSSSVSPSSGLSCGLSPTSVTLGSVGTSTLSCSGSAGLYSVTVSATNGTVTHTTTVTYAVQDYAFTANPTTVTVSEGGAGNSTITVSPLDGFTGTVSLGVTTNSTSLSCALSSNTIPGGSGSSTLQCSSSVAANYGATVTGTSSRVSHSVIVTYVVRDFTISASPSNVQATQNVAATSTITITPLNGFAGMVNLASNSTSCNLSPTSVTGSGSSTLSCTFTTTGTFNVDVTGTSSALSHSVTVVYNVSPPASFSLSASPTSVTTLAGTTGTSTINVTGTAGFTGMISLTASVSPSTGLACSLSPSSVALSPITTSGTSTLSCTGSAGLYTITVTGTSGTNRASTQLKFTAQDFTIAGNPLSVRFSAGSNTNSTITVTGLQGFSGVVNLTFLLSSPNITASLNPTSLTGSGASTLTVSASTTGSYSVTITGTSGSLSHNVTITVNVGGSQDFQISTKPASIILYPGGINASIVSITAINDFTGNVSLSATVPSGLSALFSNNSVAPGSTSTLSVSAANNMAIGTYIVTVTGTSGNLTHSVSISVKVLAKPSIAFVADVPVVGTSSNTATTGAMTFTKGDLIVVYVSVGSGQTVNSIADSGSPSSTYTERASSMNGNTILYLFTATAATNTNNTITLTMSAAGNLEVSAAEYSGVVGFGALNTNTGTSTTPTVSLTTQNTNSWVLVAYGWTGTGTHSADTGFADRHAGSYGPQHIDYGDTNGAKPAGSYTYSATLSQPDPWAMIALELV